MWQSFNLITSFLYVLQTRTIFHILVCKIHSLNRNNLKLSQLGDFIMPSQSWKRKLKRSTSTVFIGQSVFFESYSRESCKDDVINLFSLIPGVAHFVEDSYFADTLHLLSSIVLQSFNVMTSCIDQKSYKTFWSVKSVSFVKKKQN